MSIPPHPTEHEESGWEVKGERTPRHGRPAKPDRLGPALVGLVLVALVVAVLLLLL